MPEGDFCFVLFKKSGSRKKIQDFIAFMKKENVCLLHLITEKIYFGFNQAIKKKNLLACNNEETIPETNAFIKLSL